MKFLAFTLLVFLSVAGICQAPTIDAFPGNSTAAPGFSGATGTTMTILGTNLTGATAVSFGGTSAASFSVVSPTKITAVVGAGKSGAVSVTTPAGTVSRGGFTYLSLSRIVTDFGGYWSSTIGSTNAKQIDSSHHLLGFTFNGTLYSTGVSDSTLTARGDVYTPGSYRAFPVSGVAGTSSSTGSVYLTIAGKADGSPTTANVAGVASATVRSVLIDGIRGLDLGTGVTNLPTSAILTFNLSNIDITKVSDAEPDIIITQIADPSSGNDRFEFLNAGGVTVGTFLTQDMMVLNSFGTYRPDLFKLTPNVSYNIANPNGVSTTNDTKGIRLVGLRLSDFGITAANAATVKSMKITPSGNSDYAFIAYNTKIISATPNISQNTGISTPSVCINTNAILSVIGTASGGGALSYTWERSTDGGTTWSSVINGGNFSGATTNTLTIASPVNNDKFRANVFEAGSTSNTSEPFTIIVSQPTVAGSVSGTATVCAASNSTVLTLSGHTGSVVKWQYSTNNFSTSTDVASTTSTITATNLSATTKYRAVVQNGGCAVVNSSDVTITVRARPTSIVTGTATICNGASTTVSIALTGAKPWTLTYTDGTTPVTVAGINSTPYTFNTSSAKTYTVTELSDVNCVALASNITGNVAITVNPTGQWIGGPAGEWSNPANWCGGVPTTPVNVSIPAGSVVTIQNADAFANNMTIQPGGSLVMAGTGNLVITAGGSVINNGTFDASTSTGKVSFSGSGVIAGTINFKNIETYGGLDFGTASTINGEFTLQPGGLVTGHSPTYTCPSSVLIYKAGTTYPRGLEWASAPSGAGYPSNVYLQNNTTLNFPVVGPGYICNDLVIDNGSALNQNFGGGSAPLSVGRDVTIKGNLALGATEGGDINVGRNWTREAGGTFEHKNRKVVLTGGDNATIAAPVLVNTRDANGAFGGETFYKLEMNKATANNTVALGSHISVLKSLSLQKGIFDLSNSDVTIVSKDEETGAVAPMPTANGNIVDVTINYSGTGKFVVQRHLSIGSGSASRRWRVLSVPLQATGAPTINEAWQSGVSNADRNAPVNPWPGFGTTITKSTVYNAADGYDQGSTNTPSMYAIDNTPALYSVIPSTKIPVSTYEAYMLFARGNRGIVVSTPSINANATILEPRGRINTGSVVKNFIPGFQVFGNPYASSINFNTMLVNNYTSNGSTLNNAIAGTAQGIGLTYYLWDPKTSGGSNVGKWIALSSNGDGTFTITPNDSHLNNDGIIQSGMAFGMKSDNGGGTLTISESDKASASSSNGLASRGARSIASLSTALMSGTGTAAIISEGVVNSYNDAYHNEVDGQDVTGMSSFNSTDALRIYSQGKFLSIERRAAVANDDTIFLQVQNVSKKAYSLRFTPTNMNDNVTAVLQDAYKATSTPISMTDTTTIPFEITADSKSAAADRFRIVFKTAGVLPITFGNVKAHAQGTAIAVQWNMENEEAVKNYVVERSANGREFTTANTTAALVSNHGAYSWLDQSPLAGDNYYRIKSVSADGAIAYSKTVRVSLQAVKGSVAVYPNPVTENKIGLDLSNIVAGAYKVVLTNIAGQVVDSRTIQHPGGSAAFTLIPRSQMSGGQYQLEISGANGFRQTIKVLVNGK